MKPLLTISLGHGPHELAPLPRHFGEGPDSELVDCAGVECSHVFGGLVPIICVHPRVRAPLAHRLVLHDVFDDPSIGVFRRKPPHLDR